MKISAREEYACSAVLELALNYDSESPIRVQDIAQRQAIPTKFLFQIMQILKRVEILLARTESESPPSEGRESQGCGNESSARERDSAKAG